MPEELGQEMDRVLRTALMGAGQMMERARARRADRDRAAAQQQNEQVRAIRDAARADEQARREQQRLSERHQESALRVADREWLEERDAARVAYRPFTSPAGMDRATPEQASAAWDRARHWAKQDPTARESEALIRSAIEQKYGKHPRALLLEAKTAREQASAGTGAVSAAAAAPTSATVQESDVHRAVEWAEREAPGYYTRHEPERLMSSGALDPAMSVALVEDHRAWVKDGLLPHDTVIREWARHLGQPELDPGVGVEPSPQQAAQLEQLWATTPSMTAQEAREYAGKHAPVYYTRHDLDRVEEPGTEQALVADMRRLRATGQLPIESRHEEWARHVGADLTGLEGQERADQLAAVWREGSDERGALELANASDRPRGGGESWRAYLDTDAAAAADPEDLAAAWAQANRDSVGDAGASVGAAQIGAQFQARTGQTPQEWVRDQVARGRADAWMIDAATDRAVENTERALAAAARQDPGRDTEAVGHDEDADAWHNNERTALEQASYDRAAEFDLNGDGVTDEARQAAIDSSHGFSQSTEAGVTAGRNKRSQIKPRKSARTASQQTSRNAEIHR